MFHFNNQQIVSVTEFRSRLGKYMTDSDKHPILVMDKHQNRKVLVDMSLWKHASQTAQKNRPQEDPSEWALQQVNKSEEDIKNGDVISFKNGKDALNFLNSL